MKIVQTDLLKKFKNIIHAFSTKEIGNLAFHVGDDIWHVQSNHDKLSLEINYKKESLVHMKQIHSADVHIVNEKDNFHMPNSCDALVTNKKNTPLMVMVADCSPILFYDDINKVIAVAHAGREGAFKNIIKNTIETMKNSFKSTSENIYISIGASIGVCCYKVGYEIYIEAKDLNLDYAIEKKNSNYYLDIKKILKKQLLACGVKEKNIEISNECTCCLSNKYYSYRAKQKTGRFAGVIMLKKLF